MKIIYIFSGNIPSTRANTIQVMKVCQSFAQLGHQVTLLVPSRQSMEADWGRLEEHYGLKTRFDIQHIREGNFFGRRLFAWKAVRFARKLSPDLVYARSLPPAVLGLLNHLPVTLEMHQPPGGWFGPLWYRCFLHLPGKKRLVPISKALSNLLRQKYKPNLPAEQEVIAPSGVDLERYEHLPKPMVARKQLNLAEKWTAVCSGHLYPGRGMELVLDLAKRMADIQFVWAGGNQQAVDLWREAARASGVQNLTFTGFIPNNDLPLYQAAGDALLIPYRPGFTNSGGEDISTVSSPLKVFEYLAARRPILASDLPVLREVLNQDNAMLLPFDSVEAWVQAIRQLQADPQVGISLAEQARREVDQYSWLERSRRILAGKDKA